MAAIRRPGIGRDRVQAFGAVSGALDRGLPTRKKTGVRPVDTFGG